MDYIDRYMLLKSMLTSTKYPCPQTMVCLISCACESLPIGMYIYSLQVNYSNGIDLYRVCELRHPVTNIIHHDWCIPRLPHEANTYWILVVIAASIDGKSGMGCTAIKPFKVNGK